MRQLFSVKTQAAVAILAMAILISAIVGIGLRQREAEAGGLTGDASCDGSVNSIDAALILQFNAGFTTLNCSENADVNRDGRVDSVDASLEER